MATWLFDCISKIRRKTENGNQDVETSLKTRLWVDLRQFHFLNPLVSPPRTGQNWTPPKKKWNDTSHPPWSRGESHIAFASGFVRFLRVAVRTTWKCHPHHADIHRYLGSMRWPAHPPRKHEKQQRCGDVRGTFASTDSLTAIWWLAEQPVNVNKFLPLGAFAAFFPACQVMVSKF